MSDGSAWRPTASNHALRRRAQALRASREFFFARQVLEVETPAMVNAPVSDVNLGSVRAQMSGSDIPMFLHTSPEYAMKRLLAAGSGDIYQICHVYRGAERGRQHNPEFTMLEWYRLGFSLEQLMREVADLTNQLLGAQLPVEFVKFRDAVRRHAGFDPLDADITELQRGAQALGLDATHAAKAGRDELLDLIVGAQVGPALGAGSLTFMHRYPASQAALARLDSDDPRVALRFELYHRGIELANGYHELASGAEQRMRFATDQKVRASRGLPTFTLDPHLLAALDAGLPDCAGVALGFDRVLMLAMNAASIDEVLAFPHGARLMSHATQSYDFSNADAAYRELARDLAALLAGERDLIANAANTAALIYDALPGLNWAGFYLYKSGELVLGPFQGKPACVRIAMGKGVCGTAAARRETVLVEDVHAFPGHIACDSASNSEIVIPLVRGGELLGVLDLDSPLHARFGAADARGLEVVAKIFIDSLQELGQEKGTDLFSQRK